MCKSSKRRTTWFWLAALVMVIGCGAADDDGASADGVRFDDPALGPTLPADLHTAAGPFTETVIHAGAPTPPDPFTARIIVHQHGLAPTTPSGDGPQDAPPEPPPP